MYNRSIERHLFSLFVSQEMTEKIPIWLYDKKLWINDADRHTTCADVVSTLTGHTTNYAVIITSGVHHENTIMVADPNVKVLKIWQCLQADEKLCLQKMNSSSGCGGGYITYDDDDAASEMSGYRAQRKRRREVVKYASRTMHPKRLSNTQAAEELLKLILEQSDTIRAQLKKLQDRDKKIEKIETETHRTRADALGSNYLLDAYLGGDDASGRSGSSGCNGGDDKEEKDSGITEGRASVENEEDDEIVGKGEIASSSTLESITYLEKIVKINKKLYEHEERLIRLYVNIERCRDQDQLMDELKRTEIELTDTERMYRENTLLLRQTDTEMRNRLSYIEQLQYEAAIVDSENEYLVGFIEHENQQQKMRRDNQYQHHPHSSNTVAYKVLDTLV